MTTPAPWLTEPDRLEWTHEGYPCLAVRNSFGAWCGYVGVPESHPWYERCEADLADVQTHGRVSYADHCRGAVCHEAIVPVWWVGFCCAYEFDGWPGHEGPYRDVEYVRQQCANLVLQAKEAAR